MCSEVYTEVGEMVSSPIIRWLGIDQKQSEAQVAPGWSTVRDFSRKKLEETETKVAEKDTSTERERLMFALLGEIADRLKRHLGEMQFFSPVLGPDSKVSSSVNPKVEYAPLTNLGSESEFAKLDNRVKISGGTTSIQTLSRKTLLLQTCTW